MRMRAELSELTRLRLWGLTISYLAQWGPSCFNLHIIALLP